MRKNQRDTSVLDSSRGPLTIHWGWNRWITLSEARSQACSAQVTRHRALAALLVEKGLPEAEARSLARAAWKERPSGWMRRAEADPWESPWKSLRYGTLAVFLIGLVSAFIVIFVLKMDWVGV